MKAVIYEGIEKPFLELLQKNIQHKYPSASIECVDQTDILTVEPAEDCIVMILDEHIVNDEYISYIKDAYRNLEYLVCLVEQSNQAHYQKMYGSICKVLIKNKKELQRWFDNVTGEPKKVEPTKDKGYTNETKDIDILDELTLNEEEINNSPELEDLVIELDSQSEEEIELEDPAIDENLLTEIEPSLEEPDLSLPIIEDDEPLMEGDMLSDTFEIDGEDNGILSILEEPDLENSILEEPIIEESVLEEPELEIEKENDSLDMLEEPEFNVVQDLDVPENEDTAADSKVSNPSINMDKELVGVSAKPKLTEKQIRQQQYEERVISLRDSLEIPVWKKRKLESKTIGVWSPLHRTGVTTFAMNLALYFSQLSIPVAVLEGITKNIKMKSLLYKYNKKNANAYSYNAYLSNPSIKPKEVIWKYQGVHFFPFDERDIRYKWDNERIEGFINGLKFHDVVLVDLPTGEMAPYTLDSLQYIDELWVIINNDVLGIAEWKEYVASVIQPKVDVKLIFNEEFPFSKPKKVAEAIGFPLITSIPAVHEAVAQNHYEAIPLIEQAGVVEKLESRFLVILEHLVGEEIKIQSKDTTEGKKLNQFVKRLKLW